MSLDRHQRISLEIEQRLERIGEQSSRGTANAAHDHFILHPTKPCVCDGGGVFDKRGQLRSCPICLGLGYVRMTTEEIRDEYRAIRERVVETYAMDAKAFDEAAAERPTRDGYEPGYWLAGARDVETIKQRERAQRKVEARGRW